MRHVHATGRAAIRGWLLTGARLVCGWAGGGQDEPTSGLDAVMGELVCVLLRQLALRVPKRIIMCSVHTPSSKMFRLFTHLLVLTSHGRLAYTGPREQVRRTSLSV